ncbi:nuclear cap-binding protein subunit 2 [Anaeramoeba flamelloides]|uniref:Nuclear cap-binding protein subunit 2 n=1 Tax=Anaeramoeba flamelloides TaxID=1746091 RepID=A0AAV7ZW63_9EUKA|nr:nuclear cap-binding protein subunit [Anaeramoeba flamelloides]KAJ6252591.1 nuclear cap-binding protein subunit 2 [Anaeramoeba flamelloides]
MSHIFQKIEPKKPKYQDRSYKGTQEQRQKELSKSYTLYVGNFSFYTTEEQIYELFSTVGEVKRVIMGLNRNNKSPCGFCFVEYYTHENAVKCVNWLNKIRLDDRIISIDLDTGFIEGRQFGRGKAGGQVRDEFRTYYDPGRGGYNTNKDQPLNKSPGNSKRRNYTQRRYNRSQNRNDNNNRHNNRYNNRYNSYNERNPRFRDED